RRWRRRCTAGNNRLRERPAYDGGSATGDSGGTARRRRPCHRKYSECITNRTIMDTLFASDEQERDAGAPPAPLADRARPATLDEVIGQEHLLGEGGPLRSFFASGVFPSIILWGPPGVGKTTLALLIAQRASYHFVRISAIEAGVKEV